jgi:hypothetical protein
MKKIIVITLLIAATINLLSQEKNQPKIRISELGIYQGMYSGYYTDASLTDFLRLAPGSEYLNQDFTGFTKSSYSYESITDNTFTVNLGLQFYDSEKQSYKSNPQLNVGVTFMGATILNASYFREEKVRFDTLSSLNSAYVVYMDSTRYQTYKMEYLFQQIGINASLIYRTQPNARWSLYSGAGVSALTSLMSATHIFYYSHELITYSFPNTSNYYSTQSFPENYENFNEIHTNKTNLSAFAYIPLGVDFRIAKKNEFWSKMHLVMEMQPGLALDYIPELGAHFYGTFRGNFGLRVEI